MLGKDYVCPIHPDTPLPMMYMPDCLRATWQLITAPREALTRCTYNVTAMSFTPAQLEASIRNCYPGFKVCNLQWLASTPMFCCLLGCADVLAGKMPWIVYCACVMSRDQ